jgi:CHC2 zinc finger
MQKPSALSFKDLKQRISIEQVLQHYGIFADLQPRGKSHRGPCPFCDAADGMPFSVSLEKNCYQCFACKTSGNILEFVIQWEGVKIREAGQFLAKAFLDGTAPREHTKSLPAVEQDASPAGETKEAKERTTNVPQVPSAPAEVNKAPHNHKDIVSCNEPLTFALKNIESQHPSVAALGIRDDILTAFGVGFYRGRGMMNNRIVIPIYNSNRQLIAYAGFHPEERTYTYPPKFRTDLALYNLSGACAAADDEFGVILVRQLLDVVLLASGGHLNAIAVMGDGISREQVISLLLEHGAGAKITLFWPTHADIVPTLSELLADFFVRLRRYEDKLEAPLGCTSEEVRELLT